MQDKTDVHVSYSVLEETCMYWVSLYSDWIIQDNYIIRRKKIKQVEYLLLYNLGCRGALDTCMQFNLYSYASIKWKNN